MFRFSRAAIGLSLICGTSVFLSSCSLPEKEDPFVRPPQTEIKTLSGEVFPFSVSVATSATHRLEENNKLVSYLASEIASLKEFEGQEVEVDGFFQKEKMREIFWVEAVRLIDADIEHGIPERTEERFITKKFTFLYPINWEYSLSPDGVAYFLDKNDPARRVFLTFGVNDLTKADKKEEPNVLIANLSGKKEITTDEFDRERQVITLFSNIYEQKYEFIFTHNYEEFEKKKSFFKLLNSFQEGEANVLEAKKEDQKKQAAEEARKIKETPVESEITTPEEEGSPSITEGDSTEGDTSEEPLSVVETETTETETAAPALPPYTDLINQKAFLYENDYLGLSMKFPYGFWYQNFGEGKVSLARLGAAKNPINGEGDVQIWIQILEVKNPPKQATERQENEQLYINWPRDEKSFFKASGPVKQRDAMLSILNSIQG